MKLVTLRRRRDVELPGVVGTARVDRRTGRLLPRLRPGDVAVLDAVDLDRVTADALVGAGVGAVVNAGPSISGRYPVLGPELLVAAGIPLVDAVGPGVFGAVRDGTRVRVDGGTVYAGEETVATGVPQDADSVAVALLDAKAGMSAQLEAFAASTVDFVKRERALLIDGLGVPELRTAVHGRHVLLVCRGFDWKADLAGLRRYLKEYRPVLLGVDAGAEVLLAGGYVPDVVVCDPARVGDDALRCGAEVVLHADPDGRVPGLERVHDLGVDAVLFASSGTSTDAAMLLVDTAGAALVVAVGTAATLTEFLDGGGGTASTFLTRLRLGGRLVDAKAVGALVRPRVSAWALLLLVLAAVVAVAVALALTPAGRVYLALLVDAGRTAADRLPGSPW